VLLEEIVRGTKSSVRALPAIPRYQIERSTKERSVRPRSLRDQGPFVVSEVIGNLVARTVVSLAYLINGAQNPPQGARRRSPESASGKAVKYEGSS
jgi:hypothetical protein